VSIASLLSVEIIAESVKKTTSQCHTRELVGCQFSWEKGGDRIDATYLACYPP
jgi:hypothetical protein